MLLTVLLIFPNRSELAQEPLMLSLSDAKVNEIKMGPFSFVRGELFLLCHGEAAHVLRRGKWMEQGIVSMPSE